MTSKYLISVINQETGEEVMKPVECDGMIIVGLVGKKGEYHAVRTRLKHVDNRDMTNALYSEPVLREAAFRMAHLMKREYKGWLWRLFHREPKGE